MNTAGAGSVKGFLAKVVDRARGDPAAAAPRLPGLFEPVFPRRPGVDAIRADAFATDAPDVESHFVPPPFADAPASSRPDIPGDITGTHAAGRPRSRRSDGDEAAPAPARTAFAAMSVSVPSANGENAARTPIATSTAIGPMPRATLAVREKAGDAAADDTPPRARAPRDAGDAAAQRALEPTASAAPPKPEAQTPAPGVLVPTLVPLEAPRSSVRAETDRRFSDSAPAKAEPTIHVSIGRIEVRAPPQTAAPAARASRTQRPMSLDEYLGRKERAR